MRMIDWGRMKLPKAQIGAFIKSKRRAAGFKTQQALAHALDVDQPLIGKWEAGINVPQDENLKRLAEKLHFREDDIFKINEGNEDNSIVVRVEELEKKILNLQKAPPGNMPQDILSWLSNHSVDDRIWNKIRGFLGIPINMAQDKVSRRK